MESKIEFFNIKLVNVVDFESGYRITISKLNEKFSNFFKKCLNFLCDNFGEGNLINDVYSNSKKWVLLTRKPKKLIIILLKDKKDLEIFCDFFEIKIDINHDLTIDNIVNSTIQEFLFEPYNWKTFCKIRERISKKLFIKTSNVHKIENGLIIDYFGKCVNVKF
jgi:hypothetical protein